MKTIIIKANSILCIIFCLMLTTSLKSQAVYDTLYSYPDTTTFNNWSITVVSDIVNLAVTFWPDSSWEYYQIEQLIFSVPEGVDTTALFYFFISHGETPQDSIILMKEIDYNGLPRYPNLAQIILAPPILLNNTKRFYLSGPFIYTLSISNWLNFGVPGQYAFWQSSNEWVEDLDCYFDLKVVIKKNLTAVDDKLTSPLLFNLEQNFPNPFNSQSIIRYNSPEMGEAKLYIYDVLGNKVYSDLNNSVSIGQNQFAVNSKNIVSGVYFYSVTVNNKYSSTKKMILLK